MLLLLRLRPLNPPPWPLHQLLRPNRSPLFLKPPLKPLLHRLPPPLLVLRRDASSCRRLVRGPFIPHHLWPPVPRLAAVLSLSVRARRLPAHPVRVRRQWLRAHGVRCTRPAAILAVRAGPAEPRDALDLHLVHRVPVLALVPALALVRVLPARLPEHRSALARSPGCVRRRVLRPVVAISATRRPKKAR